jgi:phage terminase Nu1 subunit (DNA packaging protein)
MFSKDLGWPEFEEDSVVLRFGRKRKVIMPQLLTYEGLAKVMDVQPKSISDLVSKGMPHEGRNQYDVGRCMMWYVRYLHAQMQHSGITEEERNSGVNLRGERYRLLKLQADLCELELSERSAKFIPIAVYEELVVGWAITIRQRVMALPGRLSTMLVGLDRRSIQDVMNRECRDMLLLLSNEPPGDERSPDREGSGAAGSHRTLSGGGSLPKSRFRAHRTA